MTYNTGWIKIYRHLSEEGFYKKSEYIHLWLHLLLRANHSKSEFVFNDEITVLLPGQLLTGRKKLSEETGICESKIERILKFLKKVHQIEQQTYNRFRIITISSWNKYQNVAQENNQPIFSESATAAQRPHTYNNVKKENNNKKEKNLSKKNDVKVPFRNSKYFDKLIFVAAIQASPAPYSQADTDFYYNAALNGGDAHDYRYKDWLAAIKSWMDGDIKKNQFKKINTETNSFNNGPGGTKSFTQKNSEQLRRILDKTFSK